MEDIWTKEELDREFEYRMEERLALMCGLEEPTAEQFCIATLEADEAIERLKIKSKMIC